jgi:hypothetical protein
MSGGGGHEDKRIEHVVAFLLHCLQACVPEAMLAYKYLTNKSINPAKQTVVCR